ncbi:hypothetical protein [Paenibacillus sonchi]|uniref:hypothetical protein n=1 Tax=Paenibacillus sonchi TaxID=373687 RepID=UPI000FB4093E|nr:hypothetical protein [Paenibacillus sonchi]MCE3203435.1 hypothetical protein [Paenibacillus sonchi]
MSAKERFLRQLLSREGKERWVAAVLLSADSSVLQSITGEVGFPFFTWKKN